MLNGKKEEEGKREREGGGERASTEGMGGRKGNQPCLRTSKLADKDTFTQCVPRTFKK